MSTVGGSLRADLDLDGSPEVLTGSTAVHADGTVYWRNTSLPNSRTAVADFDGDGFPEIVMVAGKAYLAKHDGTRVWGPVHVNARNGGAPTVADMDGDGILDIGVAGETAYTVLNRDGSIKWQSTITDRSGITGSTVFDFDGDGKAEVVYFDENYLYVFDGTNGSVLFKTNNRSATASGHLEKPHLAGSR